MKIRTQYLNGVIQCHKLSKAALVFFKQLTKARNRLKKEQSTWGVRLKKFFMAIIWVWYSLKGTELPWAMNHPKWTNSRLAHLSLLRGSKSLMGHISILIKNNNNNLPLMVCSPLRSLPNSTTNRYTPSLRSRIMTDRVSAISLWCQLMIKIECCEQITIGVCHS